MPHCIIEYSSDLRAYDLQASDIQASDIQASLSHDDNLNLSDGQITPQQMMTAALNGMQSSELFAIEDIKIRTIEYAHFQRGSHRENFIHLTIKILSGRNTQKKKSLSTLVLKAMSGLALSSCEITVDIEDMNPDCYMKVKL